MIKPAALVMAVVMVGVTAGSYYGLDHVPVPPPFGRAPLADAPEPGTKGTYVETAGMATTATQVEQLARVGAESPITEADLAEPPPEAPSAETPATEPAPQTEAEAQPAAAEPTPELATAAEPEPAPAPAEPAPQPKAQAKPQPAQPAAAVAKTPTASEPPQDPVKHNPPAADVIKPWWPDPSTMSENQLKLQYAGQVQGEQAIALLFSAPLDLKTIEQHAQVLTLDGDAVPGQWELGKNPRLAVFRGVKNGRYTIVLAPRIADTKGFMLGITLKGPVYIQP